MHALSNCPQCGGNVPPDAAECRFCGSFLTRPPAAAPAPMAAPSPAAAPMPAAPAAPAIDLERGEFGLKGPVPLVLTLVACAGFCALGWALERPDTYWSKDEAVAMWIGAVPLSALVMAALWRPKWGRWLAAVAVGVFVTLTQTVSTAIMTGRLNDDAIGLGAAVGGAAAVGWLVGAVIHVVIRNGRARAAHA